MIKLRKVGKIDSKTMGIIYRKLKEKLKTSNAKIQMQKKLIFAGESN